MDRQDIYSKTKKGLEEVQNRKYNLPQAMRSLLIMIDGTKPIGVFLDQATALGDVNAMLLGLEQQEFIAKTAAVAKPAPPVVKPPEPVHERGKDKKSVGAGGLVDVASMFTTPEEEEEKKEKK